MTSAGVEIEIHLDGYGTNLASSADGKHLYATVVTEDAQTGGNVVSLVNLASGEMLVVGRSPATPQFAYTRAAVSPDGTRVIVTDPTNYGVLAIDVQTGEIVTLALGILPLDVEFSADGTTAYVAGPVIDFSQPSLTSSAVKIISFGNPSETVLL